MQLWLRLEMFHFYHKSQAPRAKWRPFCVPSLSHTVLFALLRVIVLAAKPSLCFTTNRIPQAFVSTYIMAGQLPSWWFFSSVMEASLRASSCGIRNTPHPQEPWNSVFLKYSGHNDVTGWALCSSCPLFPLYMWELFPCLVFFCLSVRRMSIFMRFRSIKLDEVKEKEGAHRAPWLPHYPAWTHPFQIAVYSFDIYSDLHWGPRACAYCFWLVLFEHELLLMSNENQGCSATGEKKREHRCTGIAPRQPFTVIRWRRHIPLTACDSLMLT